MSSGTALTLPSTAGAAAMRSGGQQPVARLPEGAPVLLPELEAWRSSSKESEWAPPPWRADELYADASGRNPKGPLVRVVGWATCCRLGGLWLVASGWLEHGASVAAGEAVAAARGFKLLNPGA